MRAGAVTSRAHVPNSLATGDIISLVKGGCTLHVSILRTKAVAVFNGNVVAQAAACALFYDLTGLNSVNLIARPTARNVNGVVHIGFCAVVFHIAIIPVAIQGRNMMGFFTGPDGCELLDLNIQLLPSQRLTGISLNRGLVGIHPDAEPFSVGFGLHVVVCTRFVDTEAFPIQNPIVIGDIKCCLDGSIGGVSHGTHPVTGVSHKADPAVCGQVRNQESFPGISVGSVGQ